MRGNAVDVALLILIATVSVCGAAPSTSHAQRKADVLRAGANHVFPWTLLYAEEEEQYRSVLKKACSGHGVVQSGTTFTEVRAATFRACGGKQETPGTWLDGLRTSPSYTQVSASHAPLLGEQPPWEMMYPNFMTNYFHYHPPTGDEKGTEGGEALARSHQSVVRPPRSSRCDAYSAPTVR